MSLPVFTFTTAAAFVMPFGKHNGKTLDDIGITDEGLLYLDWMRGELKPQDFQHHQDKNTLRLAINVYLDDETIAADLAKLVKK